MGLLDSLYDYVIHVLLIATCTLCNY